MMATVLAPTGPDDDGLQDQEAAAKNKLAASDEVTELVGRLQTVLVLQDCVCPEISHGDDQPASSHDLCVASKNRSTSSSDSSGGRSANIVDVCPEPLRGQLSLADSCDGVLAPPVGGSDGSSSMVHSDPPLQELHPATVRTVADGVAEAECEQEMVTMPRAGVVRSTIPRAGVVRSDGNGGGIIDHATGENDVDGISNGRELMSVEVPRLDVSACITTAHIIHPTVQLSSPCSTPRSPIHVATTAGPEVQLVEPDDATNKQPAPMDREEKLCSHERDGLVRFQLLGGSLQFGAQTAGLLAMRQIIARQLPVITAQYAASLLFESSHRSMVAIHTGDREPQ